jgi:putative ABC transport system substrate-binding protein
MQRRKFLASVGAVSVAGPRQTWAQQTTIPVIGFLGNSTPDETAPRLRTFRQGLGELGFVEGSNVTIEYRWAEGRFDRLNTLANDQVQHNVSVIVAVSDPSARAAREATTRIPIVFNGGNDPVRLGHVASLNRPGGNITGVTALNAELSPKRMQMLREIVPQATTIAFLQDPPSPSSEFQTENMMRAASEMGVRILPFEATSAQEIDEAFERLIQQKPGGLIVAASASFNIRSGQLGQLALRYAIPAIYQTREFAAAGGLASYGDHIPDLYRQLGIYTGRILKGERPADLPVHQSTKFELIINLKTAKALGLTIPITLLGRADEVIE